MALSLTHQRLLMALLVTLTTALFFVSLLTGPAAIGAWEGLMALLSGQGREAVLLVIWEIRLPRALLGAMVGGILGLAGAVLQGYLRNPLAEPGLLGISASASLGAALAIYTGLAAAYPYALPACGLVGALAAVALIQGLAGRTGDILTLILAGVAVSTLASALISLVLNLSSNPFAALEIVFWSMGSLTDRSLDHVALAAPFIVLGALLLLATSRALNALSLGEDVAASLGVQLGRTRWLATVGTACGVGAATAVAGTIGFIGLVVPHLLRPWFGGRPGRLLLPSAVTGAGLLLLADIAVRVLLPARDLKLGVLTALLGAPFFLWLLFKLRRQGR